MRFQNPMRPYTREDISALNPTQSGVYGIFDSSNVVIYIGSGDIRERMLAHFGGDNDCIIRYRPTKWTSSVFSGDPRSIEGELIQEYNPVCNQVIPCTTPPLR